MKKNKYQFLFLILITLLVFGFVWVSKNLPHNSLSEEKPTIQTKSLTENDFSISLDKRDWIFVSVTITPQIDIKDITLKVIYYDNNDEIMKTDYIKSYDLVRRKPHKEVLKNSHYESRKIKDCKIEFLSGTKA